MIKGVIFNGLHCSKVHLAMLDSRRPLLAETKDTYIDIPFKSGSILVPDNSKLDVMVEVDFLLKPRANVNVYDDCRAIAEWLTTTERKPLIFDDDSGYYYNAKVTGNVDTERIVKARTFTVVFRCEPVMKVVGT